MACFVCDHIMCVMYISDFLGFISILPLGSCPSIAPLRAGSPLS